MYWFVVSWQVPLNSQEEITKPGMMDMQQEVQYSKIFTSLFIRSFVAG